MDSESKPPTHENPWLLALLLAAPSLIMLSKQPIFAVSTRMNELFSLADIPHRLHGHTEYVLYVPLSAIVVCIFRLTLGLPVLSLFRPILTAVAFRIIGIPWGLAFLVAVLSCVVLLKPLIRDAHYYVRVPLILSLVAAFMVVPLIAAKWWHISLLQHFAYFPIISLSLICEAFTKILNESGLRAALWPTLNTIAAAIFITLLARIPGAMPLLLRYPEVLFLQAGIVLLIGKFLDLRLFQDRNPFLPRVVLAAENASMPSSTGVQIATE